MIPSRLRLLSIILFCAAAVSGCAGTQHYVRVLESDGTVRVDIPDDKSYDYKVLIQNKVDIGWDGGNKDDRLKTVQLMFGDRCRGLKVVDETPIEKGTYLGGRAAVTWVMKVKCNP